MCGELRLRCSSGLCAGSTVQDPMTSGCLPSALWGAAPPPLTVCRRRHLGKLPPGRATFCRADDPRVTAEPPSGNVPRASGALVLPARCPSPAAAPFSLPTGHSSCAPGRSSP